MDKQNNNPTEVGSPPLELPPFPTSNLKLEDFIIVLSALQRIKQTVSGEPAFTPKNFLDQIQFDEDGSLWLYIAGAWVHIIGSGGGSVAGSDKDIQFNDGSALAGLDSLTFDKNTNTLTLGVEDDTSTIQAPDATTADIDGAALNIQSGYGNGAGSGGPININGGGNGGTEGDGATITLNPGEGKGSGFQSGDVKLLTRPGQSSARGGREVLNNGTDAFSERFIGTVNTTDATPTTYTLFTAPANRSVSVEVKVVATRTGGSSGSAGDSAAYIRRALYKTTGGTTSLIGSVQDGFTQEDQAGWDATLVISGNDIQLQVTGATNNNILWNFEAYFIHTTPSII